MYKFVNPMKHLSKKEMVSMIQAEVLIWSSLILVIFSSNLIVRASFSALFLVGIGYTFLKCMKIQALITRQEVASLYTSNHDNTEDDYRDGDDYGDEDDYDTEDGYYNDDDYDYENEKESEENN